MRLNRPQFYSKKIQVFSFPFATSNWKYIMPRSGCFTLHCIRKKCPVRIDHVEEEDDHVKEEDQLVEEECPVKNYLLDLSSEDLNLFTRQFSPENLIGLTQFGKLYRGKMSIGSDQDKITKDVAVKIMVDEMRHFDVSYDKLTRFEDELKILQAPRFRGNPNLVKVIGCCREGRTLGIVYDLNPQDTLHNFIIRDDFKWLQRVKTALALASLLNYLHDGNSSYMLRNFDPAHIAVDQNFTPILFEFGMLVGEGLDTKINEEELRIGTCGYIDPSVAECVEWSLKSDVYAFGIVLLSLMSKRVVDWKNARNTHVGLWGVREYKRRCSLVRQSLEADPGFELQITKREYKRGCSLVHQSLEADPGFDPCDGPTITKLAMQCIEYKQQKRPAMKEVVKRLKDLRVVQQHGEACGEAFYGK